MSALPFGPLPGNTYTVCIDMQRLFLEPGEWYCADGLSILPAVIRVVKTSPSRCLFTRFITPDTPNDAHARWQHYYRRWSSVTQSQIGSAAMALHDDLQTLAVPELVFDKTTHDAFDSELFAQIVQSKQPGALILVGIETDVCVLASAMSAVDKGIRVIIVTDAVASSDPASHAACVDLIYPRFDQQIELVTVSQILPAMTHVS